MPRRLSLLVAVVGVCAAVAIVIWLERHGQHHSPSNSDSRVELAQISVTQGNDRWNPKLTTEPVDPDVAVATILDVRARFGSVLSNSELEPAESQEIDPEGGPQSFDDFLRATAGVSSPPPEVVAEARPLDDATLANTELALAMRETATLLTQQAVLARDAGDAAQQQRFSGLAMLLSAEADTLTTPPPIPAPRASE